jgi:hypothetical protein
MPHFIVITNIIDCHYLISDPYFSWQGQVTEKEFYDALFTDHRFFCFILIKDRIINPSVQDIASCFQKKMNLTENSLFKAVNAVVEKALADDLSMETLSFSLSHIGVMVDQKSGFSHVLSFFSEMLSLDTYKQLDILNQLILAWKKVHMLVIRIGITKKIEDLQRLSDILRDLNLQETLLKMTVWELFVKWKEKYIVGSSYL